MLVALICIFEKGYPSVLSETYCATINLAASAKRRATTQIRNYPGSEPTFLTTTPTSDAVKLGDASSKAPRLTVWFDGACPLCIREVALFRRLDKRRAIRFEDVSSADASCPIDRAELLARFHAQEKGKPIVSGAAAFAAMWRAIPMLKPFGEAARLPAVLWVLERLYVVFLRIRPRIQRWFLRQGRTQADA